MTPLVDYKPQTRKNMFCRNLVARWYSNSLEVIHILLFGCVEFIIAILVIGLLFSSIYVLGMVMF